MYSCEKCYLDDVVDGHGDDGELAGQPDLVPGGVHGVEVADPQAPLHPQLLPLLTLDHLLQGSKGKGGRSILGMYCSSACWLLAVGQWW